jgi:hypothetical protein
MDLDSEPLSSSLGDLDNKDVDIPSIWSMDGSADEEPKDEASDKESAKDDEKHENAEDDELEKPSFLRRFKRNKNEKTQEKTEEQ